MVHGIVRAPTLDLANRDLVESHLQAGRLAGKCPYRTRFQHRPHAGP